MACKYKKLRGKIYEKFESLADFSKTAKINKSVVSLILAGKRRIKLEDMKKFCEALDIKSEEIADYFF